MRLGRGFWATKLDGKTLDLAAENIAQVRHIFPDVVEEGKIDFDKHTQCWLFL